MELTGFDMATVTVIRAVRERRLAEGLCCPRCTSTRVVRWGQFRGRQRYRCRACRRCFSDLTLTPFSYIKRLDAWPAYFRSLASSLTVRSAAAHSGVGVRTSFRWRHLILDAIWELDGTTLSGLVEFAETSFRYSRKGHRRRGSESVARSDRFAWIASRSCVVVVARDRSGGHRAEPLPGGGFTGWQVRAVFDELLAPGSTLLCNIGRYGPYRWLTHTPTGDNRCLIHVGNASGAGLEPYHNRNARRWVGRLNQWLVRFRGVASHYIPSYLAWRRMLDLVESGPWLAALLPCLERPSSPTLPGNSGGGRGDMTPANPP